MKEEIKVFENPTAKRISFKVNFEMGWEDLIDIGDVARRLNIKGFSNVELFEFLRNKSVFTENNEPYQKYVDCGYFRVVECKWYDSKRVAVEIVIKTLVFQKGLDFISKLLKKEYHN